MTSYGLGSLLGFGVVGCSSSRHAMHFGSFLGFIVYGIYSEWGCYDKDIS